MRSTYFLIVILSSFLSIQGLAWTKRGHEIIASVAARILEEKKNMGYLRSHEFDLGYYANVPDLIWRVYPSAVKIEPPQHFIDWTKELQVVFPSPLNLPVEFEDYKTKMGEKFANSHGLVPFRIHDLIKRCRGAATDLNKDKQGPLLVCVGELSHYTGDLSMPLHVSENYDGELTNQKGIHGFFESFLVDQLDPEIKIEVEKKALTAFDKSPMGKLDADGAVRWMISDSLSQVDGLLSIDKKTDRKNVALAKKNFKSLILDRLVQGAIFTAYVWKDILNGVQNFDDDHFNFFDGKPDYVEPESH